MLYSYLIEIRHKPQYANGAYRRHYQPFNALNSKNALLQAVQFCQENAIDCVGFEIAEGYPVNKRERFKMLKRRRLEEERAQSELIRQLIEHNSIEALL